VEKIELLNKPEYYQYGIIAAGVISFIFFAIIMEKVSYVRRFIYKKSYEDYKEKNPKCIQNSKTLCYKCGASDIHVEAADEKKRLYFHICKQCGASLFRSFVK